MRTIQDLQTDTKTRSRRRREGAREAAEAQTRRPARNDLLPHLKIINWPIERLTVAGRQVRKLTPQQVERLKTSFKTYGVVQPILIKGSGEIVKGRTRVEAAKQLELTEIPAIVVDHLNEAEIRALRIALSNIGERGQWDPDELRLEISELIDLGAPIDAMGFGFPEIEAMLIAEVPDIAIDDVPPVIDPPTSRVGDVWRLGSHRLVCGDATKPETYELLLGDEQVQFVLTDVPFNVPIKGHVTSGDHPDFAMAAGEMSVEEFEAFNVAWVQACMAALKDGGLLATFIDWRSVNLILTVGEKLGLDLLNLIVWAKSNGGMGSLWRSQHELLPVFKKPGESHINNVQLGKHGRWRSNVWQYPGASSLGSDARDGLANHPTVKPVALLEDALLDVTNKDDLVLEPFAGSGSTLIACQSTGRRCRAIELEPAYVDVVVRRWQAMTCKPAILEETGLSFDEVAADRGGHTGVFVVDEDSNPERGGA